MKKPSARDVLFRGYLGVTAAVPVSYASTNLLWALCGYSRGMEHSLLYSVMTVLTLLYVPPAFLLVFVGGVTGVGGGVLRDMMAGDTPCIFVKHVYASASLAGAALVFVIQGLSAHFRWNLPRAHD